MILYHICRPVSKRNKMHDREIALWNARMRIYFDANVWSFVKNGRFHSEEKAETTTPAPEERPCWPLCLEHWFNTDRDSCQSKDRLGCRNLRRHSPLPTWWTHIFFFRSFYFFSSRMPCLVVSLWACSCARKGMIFHLCLRRHVFESKKTHDREIALWNARMRINLDASLWDIPCSRIRSEGFTGEPLLTESDTLLSNRLQERFLRKESLGMPQPAAALSITNMMNPQLFFFIPMEGAHRWLPRRPPQLGGGIADTEPAKGQEERAVEEEEGEQ